MSSRTLPAEFSLIEPSQVQELPSSQPEQGLDTETWLGLGLLVFGAFAAGLAYYLTNSLMIAGTIFAVLSGLAIMASPFVGLCLVVLCIPLQSLLQVLPGVFTLSKLFAVVTAVSFLPRLLAPSARSCMTSRLMWWYLVPTLWGLLLVPLALAPVSVAGIVVLLQLQMVGLVFLMGAIPTRLSQLRTMGLLAGVGGCVLGIWIARYGTLGLLPQWDSSADVIDATNHTIAQGLSMGLIMSVIAWRGARPWTRVILLGMGIMTVFAIGLTNSRSSWMGIIAATVLPIFLARRLSIGRRITYLLCAALVGVAGFSLVLYDVFGDTGKLVRARLESMTNTQTSSGRLEYVWPEYLEFIKAHPVIGGGPGTSVVLGVAAHNDTLRAAAEGGIVGVVIYFAFLVVMVRTAIRARDPWLRLTSIAFASFWIASGLFGHSFYSQQYALAVGAIAGMAKLDLLAERRGAAAQGDVQTSAPSYDEDGGESLTWPV